MRNRVKALGKRLFRAIAWVAFLLSGLVIVTGFLLGTSDEGVAQDDGEAKLEEQVDQKVEEAFDEAARQAGGDGEMSDRERAAETERLAMELADRETGREASGVAESVASQTEVVGEDVVTASTRDALEETSDVGFGTRAISFFGILAMIGVAWLLSTKRREVDWKLVAWGVGLQLLFALIIFKVPGGDAVFEMAMTGADKVLEFTDEGSQFIFESQATGQWEPALHNFAFKILPTIIFFSSLMTILYHLGVMQKIVYWLAKAMQKVLNTSGAETLSAAANIFVGQTEAPLVVKPYIEKMTRSELAVVMTGGFATVAGGVFAAYVGLLSPMFPEIGGHLLAASVMSAPAALVIAKILYPEMGEPETLGKLEMDTEKVDANLLDAASRGAGEGLKLALNVGAMLLAFIALIAMVDYLLGLPSLLWNKGVLGDLVVHFNDAGMQIPEGCTLEEVKDAAVAGCIETMQSASGAPEAWVAPSITLEEIFGWLFFPFAWVMGVPFDEAHTVGQLLGQKMVINEFVAYMSLAEMLQDPNVELSGRSVVISTYALCGFANFGSIGIQLGGIGGIAPSRMKDLAQIALRAMIGGTLAAFMTATVAGILV
ncbi:MAG: NupC/NupG family nucleoside CNT transporter [Persicimonas sp.]